MDPATMNTMANFARGQELRVKIARLQAKMDAMAALSQSLGSLGADTQKFMQDAQQELAALEAGSGPGLTADFGYLSTSDQALRTERFAGKAATVDFVKANPTCTETAATEAYKKAALASRPPDRQWLLQDPLALRQEYTANLLAAGLIVDATWESWRAWILATDRDIILGLQ